MSRSLSARRQTSAWRAVHPTHTAPPIGDEPPPGIPPNQPPIEHPPEPPVEPPEWFA